MRLLRGVIDALDITPGRVSEDDFYRICERESITVRSVREPFSWWMMVDGRPYIAIDRRLRGLEMLFTMFHELGHHFLHAGEELHTVHAFGSNNSKKEFEADVFAYQVICPTEVLLSGVLDGAEQTDPYLPKFRRQREKLYFLYGV